MTDSAADDFFVSSSWSGYRRFNAEVSIHPNAASNLATLFHPIVTNRNCRYRGIRRYALKKLKPRFAIKTLLMLVAASAVSLAVWRSLSIDASGVEVNRFTWIERANGIASQRWESGWRHADKIFGIGSCVILHHSQPDHEKYGSNGGYEVAIQLPPDTRVGDRYVLSPVPPDRAGEPLPHDERVTVMRPGEFTVYTFGDHIGSIVARSEIRDSTVTIRKIASSHVTIHAEIDVTIPEFYDLKLDREFILVRKSRDGG